MAETKVTAAEMRNGVIRMIQGGSGDDWSLPGNQNWEISSMDVMLQEGVISSGTNGAVSVTFPVPFENIPRVMLTLNSSASGATMRKIEETPTGFTAIVEKPATVSVVGISVSAGSAGLAGATITWSAKGKRASTN